MPDSRTAYMKALLQPKPKEAEPEKPMRTADILRKRRQERTKREAEIQRKK